MPFGDPHVLGRLEKFYVASESTAGVFEAPASTDAMKILSSSISVEQERRMRDDKRATRSLLERITGKASAPFSVESYVVPSGTAGTPPDIHNLLFDCFGAYTNTPATSDVYTLGTFATCRTSSLVSNLDTFQQQVIGAATNTFTLNATGGDEPKMTFEGWGTRHVHTGYATQSGAVAGNNITLQSGEGASFEVDSLIQAGSDDNGGAGFLVTVVAGDVLTLNAAPTSVSTDVIKPFAAAAETTAGSPINGVTGSILVDSVAMPITGFDVTLSNEFKPTDDEAFELYPTDIIVQRRTVSGTVTARLRRDQIIKLGQRKLFGTHPIVATLGSGAGTTVVASLPTVEFDFAAVDIPSADEAVLNLPFTALGLSGEDEFSLTFQ